MRPFDQVQKPTQNRALFHGGNPIPSDGPACLSEAFPVCKVKNLDQAHVTHLVA